MDFFVGREQELKDLRRLDSLKKANLVTVQGRRRIGKSRLIKEYAKDRRFLSFTGRAPVRIKVYISRKPPANQSLSTHW